VPRKSIERIAENIQDTQDDSDTSTAVRLRMGEQAVVRARDELVAEDLVAYRSPLTQVLSLPDRGRVSRGNLASLGEIFQALGNSNHQMRRS
jgi:hypothetical protein